jgi:hypothetical protein
LPDGDLRRADFTRPDGTGLFTRRLTLRNTGEAPLALTGLDVWAGRAFPCQFGSRYWGENWSRPAWSSAWAAR